MTPKQFNEARELIGMERPTIARRLRISEHTVYRYERGYVNIPDATSLLVEIMVALTREKLTDQQKVERITSIIGPKGLFA